MRIGSMILPITFALTAPLEGQTALAPSVPANISISGQWVCLPPAIHCFVLDGTYAFTLPSEVKGMRMDVTVTQISDHFTVRGLFGNVPTFTNGSWLADFATDNTISLSGRTIPALKSGIYYFSPSVLMGGGIYHINATGLLTVRFSRDVFNVGIFRDGFFWILDQDGNQQFNSPPDRAFAFGGIPGDIPITGDWNGSGTSKVGVYRSSNGLFILDYDGDGQFTAADKVYNLGVGIQAGDVPVVGDWNGDGRTKVGLFRQGFFWILDTNGNGVFEQSTDSSFACGGVAGDVPIVGDWNGTGTSKVGVFRAGFLWILDTNGNHTVDAGDQIFAFGGIAGDVPVVEI